MGLLTMTHLKYEIAAKAELIPAEPDEIMPINNEPDGITVVGDVKMPGVQNKNTMIEIDNDNDQPANPL